MPTAIRPAAPAVGDLLDRAHRLAHHLLEPDGSYQVCTSLGTAGNGPGTCINYPAAPAPDWHKVK